MKKKILSLVLALCMCLTLLPAQAFAAAAEGACNHQPTSEQNNKCTGCSESIVAKVTMTGSDVTSYYLTVSDAVNKAAELSATNGNETVTVTLLSSAVWGTGDVIAPTGTYTIDLNGKNLNIGDDGMVGYKTLTIPHDAHVTIKWSSAVDYQQGAINCSGVTVDASGSLTLERVSTSTAPVTVSGSLTLGTYGGCSGTVTVNNGGTVTLNGLMASITTLTAENGGTVNLWQGSVTNLNVAGGTVHIDRDASTTPNGSVNIYGAVGVTGGTLTVNRGGFSSESSITISGGTVELNGGTVEGSITVKNTGTFTCGQDSSNNPTVNGDVTVQGGTVTITRGNFANTITISDNGAVTIGGGNFNNVTVSNGTLTVQKTGDFAPWFNSNGTVTIGGGSAEISAGTFEGTLKTTVSGKTVADYLATGSRAKKTPPP